MLGKMVGQEKGASDPLIGEEKRFLRNGILSGLTLKVFSVAFECFYMRGIENNL